MSRHSPTNQAIETIARQLQALTRKMTEVKPLENGEYLIKVAVGTLVTDTHRTNNLPYWMLQQITREIKHR